MHISTSNPLAAVSDVNQMQNNIFYILSTIIVLIGLVISSFLGVFAVKEGEKLTMTQALMVVGIPLAVYLIFTIGSSLLLGGL